MTVTVEQIEQVIPGLVEPVMGNRCLLQKCRRLTAGASADTWWLQATVGQQQHQWILRLDAGGEDLGMAPGKQW